MIRNRKGKGTGPDRIVSYRMGLVCGEAAIVRSDCHSRGLSWGSGTTYGLEEGSDRGEVLLAWGRLDAAGDVNHPGLRSGDPLGDIFGSETASQDEAGQAGHPL